MARCCECAALLCYCATVLLYYCTTSLLCYWATATLLLLLLLLPQPPPSPSLRYHHQQRRNWISSFTSLWRYRQLKFVKRVCGMLSCSAREHVRVSHDTEFRGFFYDAVPYLNPKKMLHNALLGCFLGCWTILLPIVGAQVRTCIRAP